MKSVSGLELLADRSVDQVVEPAAVAAVREPDEVGEERRVHPLPTLVRGDARELEEVVDVLLAQLEHTGVFAGVRGEPVARRFQPLVHARKRTDAVRPPLTLRAA